MFSLKRSLSLVLVQPDLNKRQFSLVISTMQAQIVLGHIEQDNNQTEKYSLFFISNFVLLLYSEGRQIIPNLLIKAQPSLLKWCPKTAAAFVDGRKK